MTLSIEAVHSAVRAELRALNQFAIFLFWLRVDGDRDSYSKEIAGSFVGHTDCVVLPIVLRRPIFRDPNSWAMDVASVITDSKELIDPVADRLERGSPLAIVVLAKTPLQTAQASSPARLPTWFPRYGGQEVTAFARDLDVVAGASLKGDELRVADLSCGLFSLERAACERFELLLSTNKHHGQPLWNTLLKTRSGIDSRQNFVLAWKKGVSQVGDPYSFRPSLKDKWSLVAALWSVFVDTPPATLGSTGEALREFLGLSPDDLKVDGLDSLLPIFFRGVNDISLGQGAKFGRSLIVIVGVSCQLTTASAHADQYGRVRASLLSSVSIDLRDFLARTELLLNRRMDITGSSGKTGSGSLIP